jgi:hypothetical protein
MHWTPSPIHNVLWLWSKATKIHRTSCQIQMTCQHATYTIRHLISFCTCTRFQNCPSKHMSRNTQPVSHARLTNDIRAFRFQTCHLVPPKLPSCQPSRILKRFVRDKGPVCGTCNCSIRSISKGHRKNDRFIDLTTPYVQLALVYPCSKVGLPH